MESEEDEKKEQQQPLLSTASNNNNGDPNSIADSLKALWHRDLVPFIPARYVLAMMGFLGFVNVYALRINLSMAIVAMVNSSANHSTHLVRHNCHVLEQYKLLLVAQL